MKRRSKNRGSLPEPFHRLSQNIFVVGEIEPEAENVVENCGFWIEIAVKNHSILQTCDFVSVLHVHGNFRSIYFADAGKRHTIPFQPIVVLVSRVRERFNRWLTEQSLQ